MEGEVVALLQQLQDAAGSARGSNAEQLELFQQAQERALHRDPSGAEFAVLRAALPFLLPLTQLQNAALASGILQLLARAAKVAASSSASLDAQVALSTGLFEAAHTVLLLSYSTEKNVLLALQSALAQVRPAFQSAIAAATAAVERQADDGGDARGLVDAIQRTVESAGDLVASGPIDGSDSNQSSLVWLRAWKLLETSALLLSTAQDAAVFRDPARSNVLPDALTVDRIVSPEAQRVLEKPKLEALGMVLVERMSERVLGTIADGATRALGRREMCVAVNSLSLLAALRPQLMPIILPTLFNLASSSPASGPSNDDPVVQKTLQSNLVKLLSHPSAQTFVDEITDVLIAAGASERAFRAISKSKEPRRKYVSDVSLQKARVGKRSAAQTITERVENANAKRIRVGAPSASTSSTRQLAIGAGAGKEQEQVTHDGIVNMPTVDVVNLVLETFACEMPKPPPSDLKLELAPSELKSRMTTLLSKFATPSSALALEKSLKRSRDPRRRRDPRVQALQHDQPSLVQIFDDASVEEMSDWISKNAASIAEPLISVLEDNSIQVYLKPVDPEWCREMAMDAFTRILANEYGVKIRGDGALREHVLCRLAANPWLLQEDGKNAVADSQTSSDNVLPTVLKTLLDFVLEDYAGRATLGSNLMRNEYFRATAKTLKTPTEWKGVKKEDAASTDSGSIFEDAAAAATQRGYFRESVTYFFDALAKKLDLASSADRKIFGNFVAQLPCVTVELLRVVKRLFHDKNGVVLGITVLRDLVKERQVCQAAGLLLLLRYTCHDDEHSRNSSIRCVANQLYTIGSLKHEIEVFAERLVDSLREAPAPAQETPEAAEPNESADGDKDVDMEKTEADEDMEKPEASAAHESSEKTIEGNGEAAASEEHEEHKTTATASEQQLWLKRQVKEAVQHQLEMERELLEFATESQREMELGKSIDGNEMEILRRLELFLALCAKKPSLLSYLVAAYAHTSEAVRQVIFQAIDKLIKHLKQRGSVNVVAQLHGFEASALGLVCHVIQILSVRTTRSTSASSSNEDTAEAALVAQVVALYHAHEHVPDAISVLIPVLPRLHSDVLFPLLPALLALPPPRVSVAVTKLLEAMPPQPVAPIDLLVALHHVDLKSEPSLQKKAIHAINCCVEHRHAFPADVLLHVCRVLLVQDEHVSKLALRTLILSVTSYPSLQSDAAELLDNLAGRRVWDMGDAIWRGFVKSAALVQPASFPLLAQRLPAEQLRALLDEEPALTPLLCAFVAANAAQLRVAPDVQALLSERSAVKEEAGAEEGGDAAEPQAEGGAEADTSDNVVKVEQ